MRLRRATACRRTERPRLLVVALASALLAGVADLAVAQSKTFLPENPVIEASAPGSTTFTVNPARTRLEVNSAARRVVIKWDSFDIGQGNEVVFTLPDGKSIAVNRVACSANCDPSSINGVLRSNGNVWLLNPAGVFFGVGARVDVAGLLATPAALDDLRGFVTAATEAPVAFSMPSNPGPVFVAGGAELLIRGGPAVLVGRKVTVAGTVKAADEASDAQKSSTQVLYGAAGKFRLLLKESAPSAIASGDLDLFDFIIDEGFAPSTGASATPSPSIDIASGSLTRAGQVLVRAKAAKPAAGEAAGGCADCIAVKSSLQATATDREGPLSAALSVRGEGVDLVLQRTGRLDAAGAAVLDPLVSLSSRGSAQLEARSIVVPQLQTLRATGNTTAVAVPDHVTIELASTGPALLRADESILLTSARLGGARLEAKGDVVIDAAIADPGVGAIKAGGSVFFGETRNADGSTRSPLANFTVGDVSAGGDLLATYRKELTAARVTATGIIDLAADVIRLGAVTGAEVTLNATAGTVDIGTLTGTDFIGGDVRATAGPVALTARDGLRAGAVSSSAGVSVRSSAGAVRLGRVTGTTLNLNAAGGDLLFAGGSAQTMRATASRNLTVSGELESVGNAAFVAGATFANSGAIRVANGTVPTNASLLNGFGGVDIRAVDVDIGAAIAARGTGVGIQFLASGAGGVVLGDGQSAPSGSLQLSNAELQRLEAPSLALRTAASGSASAGTDILVGDLTLERSRIGQLTLATGSSGRILVRGKLRGGGAPAVILGEASLKPAGIEISGALGAADAALGALQLRSAGNILIGSGAFIDQVKTASNISTFDVDAISPTLGGISSGQLFIVSGPTSFDTSGAILQQNTGGRLGDGIRIGVPSGDGAALLAGSTASAPSRVALFGSIVSTSGIAANGPAGAATSGVLASGTSTNSLWRINTCIAGSGNACTARNDVVTTIVAATPTVTTSAATPTPSAGPSTASTPTSSAGGSAPSGSSGSSGSSGEGGGQSSGGNKAGTDDKSGADDKAGGEGEGDNGGADDDSAGGDQGDAGASEDGDTSEDDSSDAPDAGEDATAEVASASTQSAENDLKPIEVDPGSLDLLNPAASRDLREAGVGSANEDLWPERTP